MGKVILTSVGVNNKKGKDLFSSKLCDIELSDRKLLIVTLKKYGISGILRDAFVDFGYSFSNIFIIESIEDCVDNNIYDTYISEGNVFSILELIKKTSLEDVIIDSYNNGAIYMGSSAGAMIAGKDIFCGKDFDKNDREIKDLDALNLVSECEIIPHYTKRELARYIRNTPEIKGRYKKVYNIANDDVIVI